MSNGNGRKPLEFYLGLRYPITIYPAEEGGFVAEVQELPGCMTQGETIEEVVEFIEDARRSWIEAAYQDGQDIPLPRTMEEFSGRFLVRLPKYLHRRLAEAAQREAVSLNQYVASLLSSNTLAEQVLHKLEALPPAAGSTIEQPSEPTYEIAAPFGAVSCGRSITELVRKVLSSSARQEPSETLAQGVRAYALAA